MTKVITAFVGANGVLNLDVTLTQEDANKAVRITVQTLDQPIAQGIPTDRESWLRFIERTAGSITDPSFERHPQGYLETRDSLP